MPPRKPPALYDVIFYVMGLNRQPMFTPAAHGVPANAAVRRAVKAVRGSIMGDAAAVIVPAGMDRRWWLDAARARCYRKITGARATQIHFERGPRRAAACEFIDRRFKNEVIKQGRKRKAKR